MNANQIIHLYQTRRGGENAPEINEAIKWYLETYIPARLEEAEYAKNLWRTVEEAAYIEGDTRKEREAVKAFDAVNKAAEALAQEADDWKQNGKIFLF